MIHTVSVVIPFYNAERTLTRCLDSLTQLDYPQTALEILLIDNASTDSGAEIVKQYSFSYLFEKRKNAYSARNRGIRESRHEIVAFTDADCMVDPDWLNWINQTFSDKTVGACGGEIVSCPSKQWIEEYPHSRGYHNNKKHLTTDFDFLPWIDTANAAYRRELFDAVGLFDDLHFDIDGDVDMGWRSSLQGYRLRFVPEAKVFHINRGSLKSLLKQNFGYGYSIVQRGRKYQSLQLSKNKKRRFKPPVFPEGNFFTHSLRRLQKQKSWKEIYFFGLDLLTFAAFNIGILKEILCFSKTINPDPTAKSMEPNIPQKGVIWWGEEELYLFNLSNRLNYRLNKTASVIWKKLRAGLTPDEVVQILMERWGGEEEMVRKDVMEFICHFLQEGLLDHPNTIG